MCVHASVPLEVKFTFRFYTYVGAHVWHTCLHFDTCLYVGTYICTDVRKDVYTHADTHVHTLLLRVDLPLELQTPPEPVGASLDTFAPLTLR